MRDRLPVVFVVFVVVAVAAAVFGYVRFVSGGPDRQAQAEETVAAYVAAWEAADWETLAGLTLAGGGDATSAPSPSAPSPSAPADEGAPGEDASASAIAAVHASAWQTLEVAAATVEAGSVTLDRGRADADLDVTLTLAGIGDWAYESRLVLLREEGEWRVQWDPDVLHPELDAGEVFVRRVTEVTRAPILAHDGTALSGPGEVVNVGIEPRRVESGDRVVAAFAEHTEADPEDVRELLARDDLRPTWFYPVITLRRDEFEDVEDLLRPVPGIVFQAAEGRVTPRDDFAAHVLGRTGEITAELLEELGDPYTVGDIVGRSGLERVFEERLSGRPGAQILVAPAGSDAGAETADIVASFDEQAPEPVRTTLDLDVQTAAEVALDGVEQPAAIVALDPEGAVRAVASRPLNEFNRALAGQYPPGSTFKIVTTAAVLAHAGEGVTTTCPAEVAVGGRRIRNAHDLALGDATLAEAFAQSCNTAFAQLAADLDPGDLEAAAADVGFGTRYDLPLPVAGGEFPEPGDLAERVAAAIGQGRVQASPLHMATVAAAIADGSSWRPPYLLTDEQPDDERDIDPQAAATIQEFMRAVVERGTGTAANVPGQAVHGKTGSAEFGQPPSEGGELPSHAWFVGFRAGEGQSSPLAFAVLVEGGGAGGDVAAPIAARFLESLAP